MKKTDFQLNKRIEGIQKISIKYHGKILERFFSIKPRQFCCILNLRVWGTSENRIFEEIDFLEFYK